MDKRKTEVALRSELTAVQKMLTIQQNDNCKFQEHAEILSSEIESLQELLRKKQLFINRLHEDLDEKNLKIKELEFLLRENKIDEHAFKTFEHQNILLLNELKEGKQKIHALEVEVKFLRNMNQDKADIADETNKKLAAMEIVLMGLTSAES